MSRIAILVVLCAILSVVIAYQTIGPHEPKPEQFKDQPGCFVTDLGRVLAFEEEAPSKTRCEKFKCEDKHIVTTGCGVVAGPANCKTVSDKTKPYPDCCPRIECP